MSKAIYTYECENGHRFEDTLETDTMVCPECKNHCSIVKSTYYDNEPSDSMGLTIMKVSLHPDSRIPTDAHNTLTHRNREKYESILSRQGKEIEPEDM